VSVLDPVRGHFQLRFVLFFDGLTDADAARERGVAVWPAALFGQ
jgi:hypothetical protein